MAAIDLRKLLEVPNDLDKRSSDALIKAIKENYISDFDYLKFLHSVRSLKDMDIVEETAFKSAFATAKTMGFTKEDFRKSLQHYRNVLSAQRESFAEALKRQRADKLTNKADKTKIIEEKIKANKLKIEKLKAENNALEEKLSKMDETIQKEREKLEQVTTNFVSSYNFFESKLKNDLELFEKYL